MSYFNVICAIISVLSFFVNPGNTGKFDVIFKEVNITCDVKHLECTASLRKERGQRPVIDLVINVVRVPENVYIQSQIHSMLAIGPTSVVSGQRIEFCKFCKNPKIDLFLNAFFRLYKDAGSSLTSCPIEQKTYTTLGIKMDAKLLPSFTPLGNYMDTIAVTNLVKGIHQSVLKLNITVAVVTQK